METSSRKIALMVMDKDVQTVQADEFWTKEFRSVSRVETSDLENAQKLIREYRQNIFLLVVFVTKESVGFSNLILDVNDIPFVLIMRASDTRNQFERILEGKAVREPFDGVLEAWLKKLQKTTYAELL